MAKKRWRNYGRRAVNWYGGGYRRIRSRVRRSYAGIGGAFLLGAVIGLTEYNKRIPYEFKIAAARLPSSVVSKIPAGRKAQVFVQGLLIGDIVQAKTGFTLGGKII
jgi:hypothetical protein